LSLAVLGSFGAAAAGNDNAQNASFSYGPKTGLCAEYETSIDNGQKLGAFGSAEQYSEKEENDIGIIVYTGDGDVGPEKALKVGEKFASVFTGEGLNAKCFAGGHKPSRGTGILFLVNGQLVPETRGLAISEAVAQKDNVIAEAKIVRQSGIKGNPDYLVGRSLALGE